MVTLDHSAPGLGSLAARCLKEPGGDVLAVREVENARDCLTEQRQEAGGPPEAPPRASAAGPDDPVTQQKAVGEEGGTRESMSPSVVVIVAPEPPAVEPAAAEPRPLVVQDYPTAGPASPTKENGAHAHTYAEPSEATAKAMMPPPGISPRTAKQNHALEPPWKKPAVPPASGVPPPRPAAATPDAAAALSSGGRYNLPSGNLSIPPNLLPGPNQSLLDSPVLLTTMTAEPSPTTGITQPIPLFHSIAASKVGAEAAERKVWRAQPSTLGSEKGQFKGEGGAKLPLLSPSKQSGRATDDGYHWRKYGEKMVKGSTYPRSYFKCSHPGCPVKKIVERDRQSGKVKDNLYKGQHTHAPPTPGRLAGRSSLGKGPATAMICKVASEGQDAKPHGDSSIKLEANVKGDSDASATTRQALESPLRGYSLLNGTSSPLLESVESITHNTTWRSSELRLAVSPLSSKVQSPLSRAAKNGVSISGRSAPPLLVPASASTAEVSKLAGGLSNPKHDMAAEMRTALEEANKMREARAEEHRNGLKAAAGGVPLALGSALPTSATGNTVKIEQESAIPEEPPTKSAPDSSAGSAQPPPSKKRKSTGQARQIEDEPLGPPESPSVVPRRVAALQAQGADAKDAKLVFNLIMESDVLEDGYRWRKYGQKLVKGNKFPRSYYKCTSSNCGVRKHLERSGANPSCVVATYEGIHTHPLPSTCSAQSNKKLSRKSGEQARKTQSVAPTAAQEDDGFRLPETGKLPAAGDVQDSQPLGIPSSEATGSPRTPNTKKVMTSTSLPINAIFEGLDGPGSAGFRLDSTVSPNLNLGDFGYKSSEKRLKLAPFASLTSGMDTPTGLTWDPSGLLSTPKSPGNITLPTPPSSLTPPRGLDLPQSSLAMSLQKTN